RALDDLAEEAVVHWSGLAGEMEVFERTGRDAAGLDEAVEVRLLQADHAAEAVGVELSLIDEAVQAAQRDSQSIGGLFGAEPPDGLRHQDRLPMRRQPRTRPVALITWGRRPSRRAVTPGGPPGPPRPVPGAASARHRGGQRRPPTPSRPAARARPGPPSRGRARARPGSSPPRGRRPARAPSGRAPRPRARPGRGQRPSPPRPPTAAGGSR